MTTLQIIALSLIGAGILIAIGFFIAFVIEISRKEQEEIAEEVNYSTVENNEQEEVVEIDIDEMLAKLEENAVEEKQEEVVAEETAVEEVQEPEVVAEETQENVVEEATQEEVVAEEVQEEATPEQEETVEEETQPEEKVEPEQEEQKTTVIIKKIVKEGPEFDYRVRLDKIKESEEKLERDLEKTEKAILKYERTERRLARNQKLLDRRAGELANLNLLMYNVTDIKNVDEDKKTRQEELVAHISELKASIEDAEKYLSANAEKHANNIKLRDYLKSEQVRYQEEWNELEILIAQAEGREPITTVVTHVEEVPANDSNDDDTTDNNTDAE